MKRTIGGRGCKKVDLKDLKESLKGSKGIKANKGVGSLCLDTGMNTKRVAS